MHMKRIYFAEFWHRIEFDYALEKVVVAVLQSKLAPFLFAFGVSWYFGRQDPKLGKILFAVCQAAYQ